MLSQDTIFTIQIQRLSSRHFPQGILDICLDVILENFPHLISEMFPLEIEEEDDSKLHFKRRIANEFVLSNGKKFLSDFPIDTEENIIINSEFQSYNMDYERETIFNM